MEAAHGVLGEAQRLENSYELRAPISSGLEKSDGVLGAISSMIMFIMAIMVYLAYTVINQLISNQLNQKTFENAMLRCLGWQKSHIMLITLTKTLLFNSFPGLLAAILVFQFLLSKTSEHIKQDFEYNLEFHYVFEAILVGATIALLLPIIAMILPIYEFF